jgi:hypothetical protein
MIDFGARDLGLVIEKGGKFYGSTDRVFGLDTQTKLNIFRCILGLTRYTWSFQLQLYGFRPVKLSMI